MRIDRLVCNLGLCPRRQVNAYIRKSVTVDGIRPPSQSLRVDPSRLLIDGKPVVEMLKPLLGVALHKPAGYLCSRSRDEKANIVYDLLPAEWVRRRPGLELPEVTSVSMKLSLRML
jgi:23S rRNA pseudouridine2604 synthase